MKCSVPKGDANSLISVANIETLNRRDVALNANPGAEVAHIGDQVRKGVDSALLRYDWRTDDRISIVLDGIYGEYFNPNIFYNSVDIYNIYTHIISGSRNQLTVTVSNRWGAYAIGAINNITIDFQDKPSHDMEVELDPPAVEDQS